MQNEVAAVEAQGSVGVAQEALGGGRSRAKHCFERDGKALIAQEGPQQRSYIGVRQKALLHQGPMQLWE
jgi:hypothetical protein